jgi:hypothetical protein
LGLYLIRQWSTNNASSSILDVRKKAREVVAESASTVEVTATDLRIGDVVKGIDGRYYAVNTLPEPSPHQQEYAVPHITFLVTEVNEDRTPIANSEGEKRTIHEEDAVLDVLTPRP